MSNFITQRIVNNFPLWTQIRKDNSSFGHRLYSSFSEFYDSFLVDLNKLQNEFNLNKKSLGIDSLYRIQLTGEDVVTVTKTVTDLLVYNYPTTIEGTDENVTSATLTQIFNFEDFFFHYPNRVALEDTIDLLDLVIWNSQVPNTINALSYSDYLYIRVYGSTNYNKRSIDSDRYFSGPALVLLEGLDVNLNPIKEVVEIKDDGVYVTSNIWSELLELPKVVGFDGSVTVGYKTVDMEYVADPYRLAVTTDTEGPLHLFIEDGFLVYKTPELKQGASYRRTGSNITDNYLELGPQVLVDNVGDPINPVSLCVNPNTSRLYVLADDNLVYVYEHGLTPFSIRDTDTETKKSYLELIPLRHYAAFDATEKMWTHFRAQSQRIVSAVIRRINPSDVVRYLQADKTWGVGSYTFQGELLAKSIDKSWTDFEFEIEYDELGQWDFEIAVVTEDKEETLFATSVMVDWLEPLAVLDPELPDLESIFYSADGLLTVYDADNFYKFQELADVYFIDPDSQLLFLKNNYTSVEVV